MDKWIVEPLKSVNGIAFGENREIARKLMGGEYTEFKKSKYSSNTTDDFGCCHIFYDGDNKVEAIEIFSDVEVEISGKSVFPNGLAALKALIPDLKDEDGSFISEKSSVGVTMDGKTMDAILFGCSNYYN